MVPRPFGPPRPRANAAAIEYRVNMESICLLAASGFFGAIPVLAVLLLSVCGYVVMKQGRRELLDSPWLWVFAFCTIGLLGVWAISGKYDDRQKRLEARYEARQRIADRATQPTAAEGNAPAPSPDKANDRNDFAGPVQEGYGAERQVPLRFLAAGLAMASVASAAMLIRAARSTQRGGS